MDCGPFGTVRLAHASSQFVIADRAVDLPACDASIIVTIDGRSYRRPIRLVNGMSAVWREAAVESRDPVTSSQGADHRTPASSAGVSG